MVLEAIREEEFLSFSYGFRPGRGAQDALDALEVALTRKKGNYVLDMDIRGSLDTASYCPWFMKIDQTAAAADR